MNKVIRFEFYNINKIIILKILLIYISNNINRLKTYFNFNIN